jgi:hypothetical protein
MYKPASGLIGKTAHPRLAQGFPQLHGADCFLPQAVCCHIFEYIYFLYLRLYAMVVNAAGCFPLEVMCVAKYAAIHLCVCMKFRVVRSCVDYHVFQYVILYMIMFAVT